MPGFDFLNKPNKMKLLIWGINRSKWLKMHEMSLKPLHGIQDDQHPGKQLQSCIHFDQIVLPAPLPPAKLFSVAQRDCPEAFEESIIMQLLCSNQTGRRV